MLAPRNGSITTYSDMTVTKFYSRQKAKIDVCSLCYSRDDCKSQFVNGNFFINIRVWAEAPQIFMKRFPQSGFMDI